MPLREVHFEEVYEASRSRLVTDFYVPALSQALTYDRAVGYFRSSVFHLVSLAISDFALRRGEMRLICSPSLESDDVRVLRRREADSDGVVATVLTRDLQEVAQDLSTLPVVQLLATLVTHKRLDVRVTYKPTEPGIFHTKVGVFQDGHDAVSFSGSANETYMAWAANEERFHAFCSWRSEYEARQIKHDLEYFERLWGSRVPGLVTKALPDTTVEELAKYALRDPEEAIEKVRLAWRRPEPTRVSVVKERRWTLQPHQAQARANWWTTKKGIISFVTGGGKTIAALEIMNDWLSQSEANTAVIVVPSNLLSRQWQSEMESVTPSLSVLRVGGDDSNHAWLGRLADYTRPVRVAQRRVVLAVANSAATARFLDRARVGEHTILIADEVHRLGAPQLRKVLSLEAGGRLGLSATPERFGDPVGTAAIFHYFGDKIEPTFGIRDAQYADPPRLVRYSYHPDVVALTSAETEDYQEISLRIARLTAQATKSGAQEDHDRAHLAMIQRARIIRGAEAKTEKAVSILREHYADGQRWLVYCDDTNQLARIKAGLVTAGHRPLQYFSAMAFSKEATIERFERLGGILLSINCLDEGIDIPSISHALIVASSINPRQHLQRRGRVLRTAPGKEEAVIHDLLVQPDINKPGVVFDHELERAAEFGQDADNISAVRRRLMTFRPYSSPDAAGWLPIEDDTPPDPSESDEP